MLLFPGLIVSSKAELPNIPKSQIPSIPSQTKANALEGLRKISAPTLNLLQPATQVYAVLVCEV